VDGEERQAREDEFREWFPKHVDDIVLACAAKQARKMERREVWEVSILIAGKLKELPRATPLPGDRELIQFALDALTVSPQDRASLVETITRECEAAL
jgi:hypothetical protein